MDNHRFTYLLSCGVAAFAFVAMDVYGNWNTQLFQSQKENSSIVYHEDFEDENTFSSFKIIDSNADNITWKYKKDKALGGMASILYSKMGLDDWLLTPVIDLKAGKVYTVSFKGSCISSSYKEKMSVYLGKGEDVSAYKLIIPEMEYEYQPSYPVGNVIITEDGAYSIGFHASSDPNQYSLFLDDIVMEEVANASAPKAPSLFRATADANGALSATLSFYAPSQTIDGKTLTSITKIIISRDGQEITTLSNANIGSRLTYTDTTPVDGNHTYTITAYNENGGGLTSSTSCYVGEDIPGVVSKVKVTESTNQFNVSWTAPTAGANGYYFNASTLNYNLYLHKEDGDTILIKKNLQGTSVAIERIAGEQKQGVFLVSAVSKGGEGKPSASNTIIVGDPYPLPVAESFDKGKPSTLWWFDEGDLYCTFSIYNYCAYLAEIYGSDDDGYLCSGKINFAGAVKPTLSFRFNANNKNDRVVVEAVKSNQDVVTLGSYDATSAYKSWQTLVVDLNSIKNENNVEIRFHVELTEGSNMLIDDINIMDPTAKNLACTLFAPAKIYGGKEMTTTVYVRNYGSEMATNYRVELYADDAKVATKEVTTELSTMKTDTVSLSFIPSVNIDLTNLYAVVTYEGDENISDNTSELITVPVIRPHSKTVSDLHAESIAGLTKLTWSAPLLETQTITEDFESYEPFYVATDGIYLEPIYKVGEWTLTDKDQEYSIEIPNYTYPNEEEAFAYMVFNPSKMPKDSASVVDPASLKSIAPHSGQQYMASFSIKEDMAIFSNKSDDWLISPELTGDAQQISFWVKSNNSDYGSQYFQILYSMTDTDVANFTLIGTSAAPDTWTEVIMDLPAGTKHFAVRCITPKDNLGIFMVDDVTYTQGDGTILGYQVYRDGAKIAELTANTASFEDMTAEAGEHIYHVSVLYHGGESAYSNAASISTALPEVGTDDETIVARYNMNGQCLYTEQKGAQIIKMANGKTKIIFVK